MTDTNKVRGILQAGAEFNVSQDCNIQCITHMHYSQAIFHPRGTKANA